MLKPIECLKEADLTGKIQRHVKEWEMKQKSLAGTGKTIHKIILCAELPRRLQVLNRCGQITG